MKPQRLQQYIPLRGINNVLNPNLGDANIIQNCRYEHRGGWVANIGVESWWKFPSNFVLSVLDFQKYIQPSVDSCYQWKRQGSNDVYTFVEQGGRLYYLLGNKGAYGSGQYTNDLVLVDEDRHVPKQSEIGSQYINLGQHLLILNGYDRAILFSGDRKWRDFGYVIGTPSCNPLEVDSAYKQGQYLNGGTALYFTQASQSGLGLTDGTVNIYNYKCTLISDIGAESPLSASQNVVWSIDQSAGSAEYKYGVFVEMPIGQRGTVARRLYRTKNITTSGEIYYFVAQINENSSRWFADISPDTLLVNEAPSIFDSTVINTDYHFGEVWDNRLWLALGNKIIYSDSGIFEQFGALSYFDLGNLVGGDVTQLKAFYNNLIVFRETAINIISTLSNNGQYTISTVTNTVGTRASNSVVLIPQLAVMFLNEQGVWSLTGGLNGGASIQINRVSQPIDQQLKAMNTSMLHKVVASYSSVEKEMWMHVPINDNNVPNMGIVLHFEPDVPMWSLRGDGSKKSYWTAMTTTIDGQFLLGCASEWTNGFGLGSTTTKLGPLQVLSASNYWGQAADIKTNVENILTIDVNDASNIGHKWESEWYNIGNNSAKTRFYSVELEIMSYGDNGFDFYYSKDYSYSNTTTTTQKQAKSETVYTVNEDAVFGDNKTITKAPFIIGSTTLTDGRLIKLRYDVNTELCDQFKFGIKTDSNQQWHLVSMNLLLDVSDLPVLNQSTRVQHGQPR